MCPLKLFFTILLIVSELTCLPRHEPDLEIPDILRQLPEITRQPETYAKLPDNSKTRKYFSK